MKSQRLLIKALLFDFDGTLTRPGAINFSALKKAINCPEEKPVLEYIEGLSDTIRKKRAMAILESFEADAARSSQPNDYAEELVCFLRAEKILTGIISRNSLRSICIALDNFARIGPADFDVIISRDDPVQPKPSAEGVLLAAETLNIPSGEIVLIGDYVFDMMAGRNAGAMTVFLDNRPDSDMLHVDCDYVVSCLSEVMKAIQMK